MKQVSCKVFSKYVPYCEMLNFLKPYQIGWFRKTKLLNVIPKMIIILSCLRLGYKTNRSGLNKSNAVYTVIQFL